MKLGDLPALAQFIAPMFYGLQFNRLILDSRAVQAGDVFIALQGQQSHGLLFAEKALAQGALHPRFHRHDALIAEELHVSW